MHCTRDRSSAHACARASLALSTRPFADVNGTILLAFTLRIFATSLTRREVIPVLTCTLTLAVSERRMPNSSLASALPLLTFKENS